MLTVLCWRWENSRPGAPIYTADHVRRLASMLRRHLHIPHRVVCLTDIRDDYGPDVTTHPLPDVPSQRYRNLRRVWIFSPEAAALGSRLLNLDLDIVIVRDVTALLDRAEPFVIWRSESSMRHGYALNPTMMVLDAASQRDIWDAFVADPDRLLARAHRDGWGRCNSDQAIISYMRRKTAVATWGEADGLVSYRVAMGKHGERGASLPAHARVVSFHGPHRDPADPALQASSPWIQEHWC